MGFALNHTKDRKARKHINGGGTEGIQGRLENVPSSTIVQAPLDAAVDRVHCSPLVHMKLRRIPILMVTVAMWIAIDAHQSRTLSPLSRAS